MKKKVLFVSIACIAFSGVLAWAEPKMNPGKWEMTTKTTMAGMPPQTVTHTQCVTNDDLVPMSRDANQECRVTDIVYKGNTVSWKISCGGQGGGMTGTGKVTYTGDNMHGTMHMTMTGSNMQVNNQLSGRRIGACDGSASNTSIHSAPRPDQHTQQPTGSGNDVERVVAEDVKDVGKAAHDEAKNATTEEVKKGVRGVFKGLFK